MSYNPNLATTYTPSPSGHFAAHTAVNVAANTIATNARPLIQNVGETVYNICDPTYATGGTPGGGTGSVDQTAIANAAAAMVTAGSGRLYAPPGLYKPSSMPTGWVTNPTTADFPFAISGEGKSLTIFQPTNSTLASSLTISNPSFASTAGGGSSPTWRGFTIDGTNATGTAVGLQVNDIGGVGLDDVRISNFTSGDSIYFYNKVGWSEEWTFNQCLFQNSANLWHFNAVAGGTATGSFDYWDMNGVIFEILQNQNGYCSEASTVANGLQHVGCKIRLSANCGTYATNTGALFCIKGSDQFINGIWDVHAESDGGGTTAPYCFNFVTSSGYVTGYGTINTPGLNGNHYGGGSYQFAPVGYINPGTNLTYVQQPPMWLGPLVQRAPLAITPPTTGGSGINSYPTTITSGTQWQNTTGTDMFVTVPVTFTGTGTAGWAVGYSGIAAGEVVAGGPTGMKVPITFVHYANQYARIDVTNATIGTPQVLTV